MLNVARSAVATATATSFWIANKSPSRRSKVRGPHVRAVFRGNELGGHSQLIAGATDAALEHVRHVELARDLRDIHVLAPKYERGRARDHAQVRLLVELVQDFLRDAVGKISLVLASRSGPRKQHTAIDASGVIDGRLV
jgi:hypothetical protein